MNWLTMLLFMPSALKAVFTSPMFCTLPSALSMAELPLPAPPSKPPRPPRLPNADAPEYAQFGLMEGDVFLDILKDLRREGMSAQADKASARPTAAASLYSVFDIIFIASNDRKMITWKSPAASIQ